MNQPEFESRIGRKVSAEDYAVIEVVYAYHPTITDVNGKEEIAAIFKIGGMGIIRDMFNTADTARGMEMEIQAANVALSNAHKKLQDFKAEYKRENT